MARTFSFLLFLLTLQAPPVSAFSPNYFKKKELKKEIKACERWKYAPSIIDTDQLEIKSLCQHKWDKGILRAQKYQVLFRGEPIFEESFNGWGPGNAETAKKCEDKVAELRDEIRSKAENRLISLHEDEEFGLVFQNIRMMLEPYKPENRTGLDGHGL